MARMFYRKPQPRRIRSLRSHRVPSSTPGSNSFEKVKQICSLCAVRIVLIMMSPAGAVFPRFSDGDATTNDHQDGDEESTLGFNGGNENQVMNWRQFYYLMTTPINLLKSDEVSILISILEKARERISILRQELGNGAHTPDGSQSVNNPNIPSSIDTHGQDVGHED